MYVQNMFAPVLGGYLLFEHTSWLLLAKEPKGWMELAFYWNWD
jgi:hypothetical protein